jgi:predicted dehydrogenase
MSGTHREAAYAAAKRFGVPEIESVEAMVRRDEIDVVYIATPPFLHHPQAMLALRAGKHVICEKPLAMNLEQADEMIALARERKLLLTANLMQRYNPMYDKIDRLIQSKALGELLHAYFENYATDEGLPPEHWFWDRAKSGGIFIEHGVHFFDLFAGWIGKGEVVGAQATRRPGTANIEEQVQCTVKYDRGVLVNFFHSFTQAGRMDRQEMRFLFERGDVTLFGWVPITARIDAIVNEEQTRELMDIFPQSQLDITENYGGASRKGMARHKPFDVYQRIELWYAKGTIKMHRYGDLVEEMFKDQLAWIQDHNHERRITEHNGRASLEIAEAADRLARRS